MVSDQVDNHSRYAASSDDHGIHWDSINDILSCNLIYLHSDLAIGLIDVIEAGNQFSTMVSDLLSKYLPILSLQDWAPPPKSHWRKEKNIFRRTFNKDPESFLNAVRVHNKYLKASRKSSFHRSAIKQEQAFKDNPWEFAKSVCKVKWPFLHKWHLFWIFSSLL
jgi:hypothetical protein